MPKIKLTQLAVERLKPPATGRVEYWDAALPAFGLRISAAHENSDGRKTWQVMYRVGGKLRRETLGTLATIPKVDRARALARASMEKAHQGIDPVQERARSEKAVRVAVEVEAARQRDTVAAVVARYLSRSEKRMKPASFQETKRALERELAASPLGRKPLRDVTRRDLRELIEAIAERGAPVMANRVLAYTRAMFSWAIENDLVEANACEGLSKPGAETERDRALDDGEIRLFWLACGDIGWPFGPLFKLLLLTAQRRDEVADSRVPEIDDATWTIPRERAKNGKAHVVHLAPLAREIIDALPLIGTEGLLFTTTGRAPVSGFSNAVDALRAAMLRRYRDELAEAGMGEAEIERAAIEPFTIHDLRRTAATGMAGLGIGHHVVDKILNHVSGAIRGVAAIYNRFEYLDERRAALDAWARHVASLVEPQTSNVVPMAKAR